MPGFALRMTFPLSGFGSSLAAQCAQERDPMFSAADSRTFHPGREMAAITLRGHALVSLKSIQIDGPPNKLIDRRPDARVFGLAISLARPRSSLTLGRQVRHVAARRYYDIGTIGRLFSRSLPGPRQNL